jgi:hypothetical protein
MAVKEPEVYKVRIEGTRPLLQHSPSGIGIKKERGQEYIPEEDAAAALYTKDGQIIEPSLHVLMAIRRVAGDFKQAGRKTYAGYVLAGLEIEPFDIPLLTASNGHAPEYTVDLRPVTVNRARVMRSRPRFDDWALEFDLKIIDPVISSAIAREMLEAAGRYIGIGDYRPLFGLFSVEKFEKAND